VRAAALLGSFLGAILLAAAGVGPATGARAKAHPRVTLKVVVVGDGEVVSSRPAGIACPSQCRLRVRRGARVLLRAQPSSGWTFNRWLGGCGTSAACSTTVSRAKSVTALFTEAPPPPPPPPGSGHYTGTYRDGSYFNFDVGSNGTTISGIGFDFNGRCPTGGTSTGAIVAPGPYPLGSDGSVSIKDGFTDSNQTVVSFTIGGKVSADGSASGTLQVNLTFSDGVACASTGTWSAHVQ
jgi:hypothetical protein